ncbi:MAG TPA: radical SAM family heme chaperone HemW [Edaphobacter sp.]|nr:radical SAM family heme chaperone HemW [Edaphobacter sp.]
MANPVGIYISVPFCKAKCTFCNFASGAFAAERMQPYVDSLCNEIASAREMTQKIGAHLPERADTVYFGGGTPSLLSAVQLQQLFECIRSEFALAKDAEITIECAPGQLSDETLDEMLRQGVNRISFGVQSFIDQETAAIGRLHTARECLEEIARVHAAGIENIGIDLITGLPYQTRESWLYSIEQAIASQAGHVSVYMLEVDDDSRLGREVLTHGRRYHATSVPSEDDTAMWYQMGCEKLDSAGIRQYEISNFARGGQASRHNLKYWKRQPYIGFGLDAHSMLYSDTGAVRLANSDDMDAYMSNTSADSLRLFAPGRTIDIIGIEQAFEEALFLGLRMNEGINFRHLRDQFGDQLIQSVMPSLPEVCDAGLLRLEQERAWLTAEGRMVSNEVFSRLLIATPA